AGHYQNREALAYPRGETGGEHLLISYSQPPAVAAATRTLVSACHFAVCRGGANPTSAGRPRCHANRYSQTQRSNEHPTQPLLSCSHGYLQRVDGSDLQWLARFISRSLHTQAEQPAARARVRPPLASKAPRRVHFRNVTQNDRIEHRRTP